MGVLHEDKQKKHRIASAKPDGTKKKQQHGGEREPSKRVLARKKGCLVMGGWQKWKEERNPGGIQEYVEKRRKGEKLRPEQA